MPEMAQPATYEDFAADVVALPGVQAADVLDRDPRVERPICEVTIGPRYARVPPRVLRAIAKHDLGVYDVTQQTGGYYRVVVV